MDGGGLLKRPHQDQAEEGGRQRRQPPEPQQQQGPSSSSSSIVSPSPLLALLSDDLLWRVLGLAGAWASGRALCRATRALADARLESLVVNPRAPASVLRGLLPRLGGLRALDLTGAAAVDDAFLRWLVLEACPQLKQLGASYCAQLTPASTPLLARVPHVALRGCWRLLRPCPSLPSEAVLELQLLALQQNDVAKHDGVAKHFEFASPANRGLTEEGDAVGLQAFAAVVYERLSPMLGCQGFSVRQLSYDSPDRACFLVRTTQGGGGGPGPRDDAAAAATTGAGPAATTPNATTTNATTTQHYLWLLSRQADGQLQGCWMTDAIISAEHGLLSFLNLPLLATEKALVGGGGGGGGAVASGGEGLTAGGGSD